MAHPDLYLKQIKAGPMANFVYLVGSLKTKECVVIDPAWDIPLITETAAADGMKIISAVATHYHPDHIGGRLWDYNISGLADLIAVSPMPVYAQKEEIEGICKVTGLSRNDIKSSSSGDEIVMGEVALKLVHTPGHTPGSQCCLIADRLVSGDTLFISGCGRVDLPGGDGEELYRTLNTKLKPLPLETIVYPGHDYDDRPYAPLSHLLKVNPYLQVASLDEWRHLRM